MCIIIVKPPAGIITRRSLKAAFEHNSDGAGYMVNIPEERRILVHKGFFGFRKYYKAIRSIEEQYPHSTIVLHMRIGTSGLKDAANCHPFALRGGGGFCHNGILTGLGNNSRSDSKIFVEDILNKLPLQFWMHDEIRECLEGYATAETSKFVILEASGAVHIFNEAAGHWRAGCWYSNTSYTITTYTWETLGGLRQSCADSLEEYYGVGIKPTPLLEGSRSDEMALLSDKCCLCMTASNATDLLKLGVVYICRDCLEHVCGRIHIQCPYCMQTVPLSPDRICEFCLEAIPEEDIGETIQQALMS